MELNREHFRAVIFYNFRRALIHQQCIDELNSIFGDEAPSRTSVYRWYGKFNVSRSSLQDNFRKCHPKSVVVPETIDAVRQLILQDRHVTYREIETTLGISGWDQHTFNIAWTFDCQKNLFALDLTQFVNRSKKGSSRLVEGNASKIRSRCFETCLSHCDKRWIVDLRVWARK